MVRWARSCRISGLQIHGLWGRYEPFRIGEIFNHDLIRDVRAVVADFRPHAIVAPMVGSENVQMAFSSPDRPLDFLSPGMTTIDRRRELVPLGLIRNRFGAIRTYIEFLHQLTSFADAPIFYPLPPPPIADTEAQRSLLEPRLRDSFAGCPMPDPVIQMRLWVEMCRSIEGCCRSMKTEKPLIVMSPPKGALDARGYLLTERARDFVHADSVYGALALEQIVAAFARIDHAASL